MRFNKNAIAATVILTIAATQTVYANTNLVSNGNFSDYQTTGITDWLITPAASGGLLGVLPVSIFGTSGTAVAFGAGDQLNDTLTQTLTTTVGTRYEIDFALAMSTSEPSNFQASFGGNELLHLSSAGTGDFINYSFFEIASTTSTELSFAGYNTNAWNYLTNVSVVIAPATVPEPQEWGMMLLGLVGIASALHRKPNSILA